MFIQYTLMRSINGIVIIFLTVSLLFISCRETDESFRPEQISVRLTEEPDRIHPMLSKTGVAAQIETKIFLPLVNADPQTLELIPVMAESLPVSHSLEGGGIRLDYRIREEASWDNNEPVSAQDVIFTYKATVLPGLNNSSWRSYLNLVDSIEADPADPKSFSVYLSEPYILAIPATGGIQVYPEYFYDKKGVLQDYTFPGLKAMDSTDAVLDEFSAQFNSNLYSRDSISGSGPYQLSTWQTGQLLVLDKKENWWGNEYSGEIPDMTAQPNSIHYLIVPDEATAIAQLRSGALDVAGDISPIQFNLLKEDSTFNNNHGFKTPEVLQQYLILLNTQDELLNSVNIRKAIAYLTDKETFIQDALQGYGRKSLGPVHPAKPYFDSTIQMPDFDISRSRELLEKEGWTDQDGDGYREKTINGQRKELEWTILITGSPLGESIALRMKENALKAGARVNIETMPFKNILQKMREGNFQMTPISSSSSPFPDDPYQSWHTSNIGGGGYNFTRFGNERTDSIIVQLRTSILPDQQQKYYSAFQEAIAEQQPAIFLAAPEECIIHKSSLELPTTAIKPGYIVNQAKSVNSNAND